MNIFLLSVLFECSRQLGQCLCFWTNNGFLCPYISFDFPYYFRFPQLFFISFSPFCLYRLLYYPLASAGLLVRNFSSSFSSFLLFLSYYLSISFAYPHVFLNYFSFLFLPSVFIVSRFTLLHQLFSSSGSFLLFSLLFLLSFHILLFDSFFIISYGFLKAGS